MVNDPLILGFVKALLLMVGLIVGSFLNVVIHRLPIKQSVVFGRSRCPKCDVGIAWYDNIPLISYLFLKGRCRNCGEAIAVRYPLVELAEAFILLACFWRFGLTAQALFAAVFLSLLLVIAFIDADKMIIPNMLVLIGWLAGIGFGIAGGYGLTLNHLIGSISALGFLLFIYLLIPMGTGMGDVKLAGMLGANLGWPWSLLGIFVGYMIGGVIAMLLLALKIKGRKDFIPFGPFLALGAAVVMFWGAQIWSAYMGLF